MVIGFVSSIGLGTVVSIMIVATVILALIGSAVWQRKSLLESYRTRKYYRYQPDNQNTTERNAEQQRVVDEYFIIRKSVPNKAIYVYLVLGALLMTASGIALSLEIILVDIGAIVGGIIGLGVGGLLLKVYWWFWDKTAQTNRQISDAQYDEFVKRRVESLDLVALALTKLGIRPSAMDGEAIVAFAYVTEKTSLLTYEYKECKLRTSTVCGSVILSTQGKLCVYKYQFDMCCNDVSEHTAEFCFADICDVSLKTDKSVARVIGYAYARDNTETSLVVRTADSNVVVPLDPNSDCSEIADKVRTTVHDGQIISDPNAQETISVFIKRKK